MLKKRIHFHSIIITVVFCSMLLLIMSCNNTDTNQLISPDTQAQDIGKLPAKCSIRAMQFIDSSDGWILVHMNVSNRGFRSGIYHTNDGGKTWVLSYQSQYIGINKLTFTTSYTGWAVGDSGTILRTSDAGKSWVKYNSYVGSDSLLATLTLNQMQFLRPNYGWVIGYGKIGYPSTYFIYQTTDFGTTWKNIYTSNVAIYPFQMISEQKGWLASYQSSDNFGESKLFYTGNNFQTPIVQRTFIEYPGMIRDLHFIDENLGYATSSYEIFKTTNGGNEWSAVTTNFSQINSISFVGNKLIFVVNGSTYYRIPFSIHCSTDAGITWTKQIDNLPYLTNFSFLNDSTGWAASYSYPSIYRYRKGTWNKIY